MSDKKTIVIVEDHTLLRQSLRVVLAKEQGLEVLGEAADGVEGIRMVEVHQPDLVLLDLNLPEKSGLSVLEEIKTRSPGTKVLVLTIQDADEFVLDAFRCGADGYCLKTSSYKELLSAVRNILAHRTYVSPQIAERVLEGYIGPRRLKNRTAGQTLTSREVVVLKLIAQGFKSARIAEQLHIGVKTVYKHRSNIMEKLDLHSIAALTAYAIERGVVGHPQP